VLLSSQLPLGPPLGRVKFRPAGAGARQSSPVIAGRDPAVTESRLAAGFHEIRIPLPADEGG
jgi:hypothetical protein